MCLYGVYKEVDVINPHQNNKKIVVDACIADEIQALNVIGIVTFGCCCGHGQAGKIAEWENAYGKWKGYYDPPNVLIHEDSVWLAQWLGYRPFPYIYADGESNKVWKMFLKTGCMTEEDCRAWHKERGLPFEPHLGVIKEG
jgi:hypothetical protein